MLVRHQFVARKTSTLATFSFESLNGFSKNDRVMLSIRLLSFTNYKGRLKDEGLRPFGERLNAKGRKGCHKLLAEVARRCEVRSKAIKPSFPAVLVRESDRSRFAGTRESGKACRASVLQRLSVFKMRIIPHRLTASFAFSHYNTPSR